MFTKLLLFGFFIGLAFSYSKIEKINKQGEDRIEFGEFDKNVHSHRIRHESRDSESEEFSGINFDSPEVFKLGLYIKPKDFAAWSLFTGFMKQHNKIYKTKKHVLRRFSIYKKNIKAAKVWQANEKGTAVYGETEFMDLTAEEFKRIYLPYVWETDNGNTQQLSEAEQSELIKMSVPESLDWRSKGMVTPVKNQGACGSCWAFSATGNVEGQWAIKKNKLISLSEQELLDCDKLDMGCNGGLLLNAYKEIIRLGGLASETEYPYEETKEPSCKLTKSDIVVYINSSLQLPKDENKMLAYLVKNGPISIGVNANPLQFYRHGISHPWKTFCQPLMLNHGVLIVGYGVEMNKPFWIIKNSWGPKWGEKGYYRLYRGKNVCGVREMASTSVID